MHKPSSDDRASARYRQVAKNQWIFALAAAVFFAMFATSCATVDATVDKVKSGVSDRFGKGDKVAPSSDTLPADQPASEDAPLKPLKKPLLVDIQEKLRALDYYSGPISGKLDSRTEAAIQDFQLDNDLRINGRPTQSLLEEIDKAMEAR